MMNVAAMILLAATSAATPTAIVPAPGDTLVLDLEDAIILTLDDSHTSHTLDLDLSGAEYAVAAAKGRFRTRADLDLVAPDIEERVRGVSVPGELPHYDSYGSREVSAQLAVSQPLPTDGEISLSGNIFQRNDSVYDPVQEQESKQQTFFHSYELSLSQPLLTPNTLKLGLERAEISHRLARSSHQRGQLDLAYDATASFYNLVRAQVEVNIAKDALAKQQLNHELAQRKYAAGLIPEVEALQMEVDLAGANNDLLGREADLSVVADRFRLLVGLPMNLSVRVDAEMVPRTFVVDSHLAIHHALEHRTELADQQDNIRQAEITITETDARSDLKGELSAFYNLTGVSDPTLQGANLGELVESSWEDLKRRPGNRGVRFSLSIPLWDSGVNGNEVAAAEVALRRRELETDNLRRSIILQVQAALSNLDGATRRLEVLERSLDVASRSYDISQQRFEGGEITSLVLADDRDRLVAARRSYLEAFISYRLAVADLRRQTLYDFEVERSLVVD